MSELRLEPTTDGSRMRVYVKPRASRSAVLGVRAGCLEVAVAAPPVDGRANAAVIETLADHLDVPRRAVSIASGEGSRTKLVVVRGLAPAELARRLAPR